jgi:1-deoxy-D-xylulose-5-phosphate reductoisomerase
VTVSQTPSQAVTILGSTGSIGASTLDVIARNAGRFKVFALTANNNVDQLEKQCRQFLPKFAVLQDAGAAAQLKSTLSDTGITVLAGSKGLIEVATHEDADCIMAAIVGGIGLVPTYAAASAGKRVMLANKEALVMAGSLFMQAVAESGSLLLPIDSEHNAIFQCLPVNNRGRFENDVRDGFARIVLTGSGGPFLHTDPAALSGVTPAEACAHPNWQMGQKISVDSATMINKALELIEACFLFGLPESAIDIMIHPQSIVHSMVHYRDGSMLAQMGNPDMRTPISYGLAWPERIDAGVASLDLAAISRLDFQVPDLSHFPCLKLGRDVAKTGGSAPVILNAANELAVAGFLAGSVRFDQISAIIAATLDEQPVADMASLEEVLAADAQARDTAARLIRKITGE